MNRARVLQAVFVTGFSLFLSFFKNMFVLRYDGVEGGDAARFVAIVMFCALFGSCAILIYFFTKKANALVSRSPVVLLSCAGASLGIAFSLYAFPTPMVSAAIGAVCIAAFLAVMTCTWGMIVESLPLRQALVSILAAFALSFPLSIVRDLMGVVPGFIVLFPLVCGGAWCLCNRFGDWVWCDDKARLGGDLPKELPLLLITLYLASSFARGLSVANSGDMFSLAPNTLLSVASTVLALVLLAMLFRFDVQRLFYYGWLMATTLVLLGLFVLLLDVGPAMAVGSDIVALGRLFIISLLFAHAAYCSKIQGSSCTKAFVQFAALPYTVSLACRELLLPLQAEALAPFSVVITVCCFVLVALTVFLIARALLRQTIDLKAVGSHLDDGQDPLRDSDATPFSIDAAATRLAVLYGFTKKEEDVCRLLVRGYTLQSVADALGVSLNTVRSHSRGIYGKVGIHSRQELITAVERLQRPET